MTDGASGLPWRLSWTLVGTAVATAAAFWLASLDTFGYPKFAVLLFGLAIASVVATSHMVAEGRLRLPWGIPAGAAAAFGVTILAIFVASPSMLALIGACARHTGALFYRSSSLRSS